MSVVYVISDTHFGHKNICKYRTEFSSMEEHDQFIFKNILDTVGKRDTLWMLGDCFFQDHTLDYAVAIAERVQYLNFVPGNHDTDNAERLRLFKHMMDMGLFHKVGSMFNVNGFWLTHPPIHPAELRGKKNIHGHVHFQSVPDKNYLNVCCENIGYKPVKFQDLHKEDLCDKLLLKYGDEDGRRYVQ